MNAIFEIILLFFGVGILIYVKQAWSSGEVRMGSKGLSPYTPTRKDSPLIFYFGILLYLGAGSWMLIYGLMLFFGFAEPPPLN